MEQDRHVAPVRRFNRFYTRAVGLIGRYLGSSLTLAEARVLYELYTRDALTGASLATELALDAGYLSRILKRFEDQGWIARTPSPDDGRQNLIALTPEGRAYFAPFDAASRVEIASHIAHLDEPARDRLVAAMGLIERLISGTPEEIVIRPHRSGDIGAVIAGQARVYTQEYGWNDEFEALVAEIGAAFLKANDPARERAFIADRAGEVVGSVFCVDAGEGMAKLRMLYVDRSTRGTGLGKRLVAECIGFAKDAGYRRMTLWTNDILSAARKIYLAEGFGLVAEENHHSFGVDLVGQNWELDLTTWRPAG
ncbi:GNAT family N-acetyltransferase [Phreatobacter aquaticus]|uniref:GNAT family N-acetyltransferase n=1 Tax=Phreatobacter aquaticus TaxID=2570229 RepID=A0A4D7QJ33_9HYPH|nr:bifunctional helix-turn-helix transcriptional regulator/GNAT family N-acetyltransferase [Phreatobacter aquaticus]QCK87055.1 GNAT family N-acetyltransferase [Phreatobacter aquaticus]